MKKYYNLIFAVVFFCNGIFFSVCTYAQSRSSNLNPLIDPRGAPDLTVCSQNLENYGSFNDMKKATPNLTPEDVGEKESALLNRFVKGKCDVIAVQEVLAKGKANAIKALSSLAGKLRKRTNRIFDLRVGESNDKRRHLGFLVAKDRARILNSLSYYRIELPKISEKQKPRLFSRGPLEIQIAARSKNKSSPRSITLVNFHFKSKRGSAGDPTGIQWETHRMEMAEALRRVVLNRHREAFETGKTVLILLGDRNSNFDAASAKILRGVLTLKHFKGNGICRLSKRGVPLCQASKSGPQRLFTVLTSDPETKLLHGTFRMGKVYSWLDEILLPAESLPFAWEGYDTRGNYASGIISKYSEASDHAMVYVRLNW